MRLFNWADAKTWPKEGPRIRMEPDDPRADRLAAHLRDSYEVIRTYHGCRPTSTATYYQQGLLPADREALERKAHEFYAQFFADTVLDKHLPVIFQELGTTSHGCIHVVLDKRDLLEFSAHYLLYGSEFLVGVGASLARLTGIDKRCALKESGEPTLLHVDLPVSLVDDTHLCELAAAISTAKAEHAVAMQRDFTITLRSPIPSSCIVGHEHPVGLKDPLH